MKIRLSMRTPSQPLKHFERAGSAMCVANRHAAQLYRAFSLNLMADPRCRSPAIDSLKG
jgi:hypothetical protein